MQERLRDAENGDGRDDEAERGMKLIKMYGRSKDIYHWTSFQ